MSNTDLNGNNTLSDTRSNNAAQFVYSDDKQSAAHLEPVYVVGPTASGKSEFAYLLAKKLNGVIISADSMQIYRTLDVGTAKDSIERRNELPYKMVDILPYDGEYSVVEYAETAKKEINAALSQGKLPIIVGGTGLYFEALFYPMSFGSTAKNDGLRAELTAEYLERGGEYMLNKLSALDKETAEKLHPNDEKRIIRALEIALSGDKTKSESRDKAVSPDVICIGFNTERSKLYDRINARVDKMFEQGLVQEVYSVGRFDCQSMQAIGYKEFSALSPEIQNGKYVLPLKTEETIKELIKQHSRNYAKRQLTWFKRYSFVEWFDVGDFTSAEQYVKNRLNSRVFAPNP